MRAGNHCQITSTGFETVLTDLNSSYGTYLNGQKIQSGEPVRLNSGDRISLANTEQAFVLEVV
jgi:pSer/pThr/pTyr-binding forkhead associated (FHA) protein